VYKQQDTINTTGASRKQFKNMFHHADALRHNELMAKLNLLEAPLLFSIGVLGCGKHHLDFMDYCPPSSRHQEKNNLRYYPRFPSGKRSFANER